MVSVEFDPITYNILKEELKKKVVLAIYFNHYPYVQPIYITKRIYFNPERGYHTWTWNQRTRRYNCLVKFVLEDGVWVAKVHTWGISTVDSSKICMKIDEEIQISGRV